MAAKNAIEDLRQWAQEAKNTLQPLPHSVYASEELLEREIATLFYREWICAGHVSEFQTPGDYLTFDIVDKPVLVVCDDAGEIRAFSNVCRHRGTMLASGSGNSKLFSCPYHAWTYDLSGRLRNAPYMDKEKVLGITLPEQRVEIWQGLIFVSLNNNAMPLAPRLASLEKRISPYNLPGHLVIYREEAEIEANWKLLVENFCESYHIFKVHKNSFEADIPTHTTKVREGGEGFNHHTQTIENSARASRFSRLPAEVRDLAHLICIYPGLALSVDAEIGIWLIVQPKSPQSLKYIAQLALFRKDDDELSQELIDSHIEQFNEFMPEDKNN